MIFFITLFRYFTIVLFFTLHFFSFSQGMQTQERAHCARSVFPFILKKKKKKKNKALLAKLPAYGFTPSFCKLISRFLSNRFISVVVDGATSASFPVSSGVPQGSVLSPTLFLLFINDLLHATASDVHSFADDSNLHKSSSFQCQPSSNARSQSRLAMSSTIN